MKSLGLKVYIALGLMGVLFVVIVLMNVSGLGTIGKYNSDLGNAYIEMETTEGEVSSAYYQVQLYANLACNEYMGANGETRLEQLKSSLDKANSAIAAMSSLAASVGDSDLNNVCGAYAAALNAYMEPAARVYDYLTEGQYVQAKTLMGNFTSLISAVEQAQTEFEEVLSSLVGEAVRRSSVQISGTIIFNYAALALYVIVIAVTVVIVSVTVVRPARESGKVLRDIISKVDASQGDLTERVPVKSKDEVGQMAQGINNFISRLQSIMRDLKTESTNMDQSSQVITDQVAESNESAGNVSAATEEMAASMQEISATLGQLSDGSTNVLNEIQSMEDSVQNGVSLVQDIKGRATEMHRSTIQGKEKTGKTIMQIRETLQVALEESRSVQKINEMTQEILSITSQTNLLSLNASIEAARAGEAGRGFAVVAGEIRGLADSSAEAANNIQTISALVTDAVEKLARNAEEMLQFVDEEIMKDYDNFVDVVEQYKQDADSVDVILGGVAANTSDISQTMEAMNTGINDISTAVEENAKGITNVADSAVTLVEAMSEIQKETEHTRQISEKLSEEVNRFKKV